jgi:hypothetical protein
MPFSEASFLQRSPTKKEDANMKSSLLTPAMTFVAIIALAFAVQAQSTDPIDANSTNPSATASPTTLGVSKVRIVRLSQVKGAVQIDRNIGRGFENAIANLPVVEHSQVRTGVGVAEIEFEDNSSLRLAPNSMVEFPRLEREGSGATASTVHLIQGTAYISLVKPQNNKAAPNEFELMFGARKLQLDPATHVRLDLEGTEAKLAVLEGAVRINGENAMVTIPKKKTATFQIFDANEPTVAKDITSSPYDAWDKNATAYHSRVSSMSAMSAFSSPYSYGVTDMMYYGSFMDAGGCGSMWRPYFASAAWDPFANGTWAWYQGAGYSWVSPYPWAWTPYHSGSWSYCPNVGWGWMPGGGWYGINNVATLTPFARGTVAGGVPAPVGGPRAPHVPIRAPLPSQPALVAVNTKPIATSEIASPTSFVFRKDSAGMGVPRGSMGNLQKFSHQAETHGFARTPIYASVPQTNRPNGSMTAAESMGTSIHRGYAPAPAPAPSSRQSYSPSFGNPGNLGGVSVSSRPTSMPSAAPAPSAPTTARGPR